MATDTQTQTQEQDKEVPSTHQPAEGGLYVDDASNDGKKVFIGNISYSATPEDIKEFISSAGGEVVSIDLPKRFGTKPAGYAFVVYSEEGGAKGAVEALDGKKLGDREISVQLAKTFAESETARSDKRAAKKEALKERRKQIKSGGGAQGDVDENVAPGAVTESAPEGGDETAAAPKKSKKKRAKKPARRLPEEGEEAPVEESTTAAAPLSEINPNSTAENTDGAAAPTSTKPKRAKRTRKPAGAENGSAPINEEAAEEARIDKELQDGEDGAKGARRGAKREPRQPREPKWIQTDVPSPTTLFVANLPFTVDDAALSELFTSLNIEVKSASIVRKPRFSQKILPRSKGFGFVEVADETAQKSALEKLAGHKIGDRELTIKVANTREPIAPGEGEEAGEGAEASA